MNTVEVIHMADEVVTQGTTIDNLPPIPGTVDKQAFIDGAFVPIRGEVNGTKTTFKVTGSDLAASGENKIDSISVNVTAVEPDASKNVNITVPAEQVQTDWEEEDDTKPGFIKNVPPILKEITDPASFAASGGDAMYISDNGDIEWGCIADKKTITVNTDNCKLEVVHPVPDPEDADNPASNGDVLTFNGDEIVWDAPQGGGGGNPYTKTTATAADPVNYDTWVSHDGLLSIPLYSQDVSISNNTYNIVTAPLGICYDEEDTEHEWPNPLDKLVVTLPAGTEFPMAVVEFTVQAGDVDLYPAVNKISVKVGNTELTRMYAAPHHDYKVLYEGDGFSCANIRQNGLGGQSIEGIDSEYLSENHNSFMPTSRVQINIFGNCYTVTTSKECGAQVIAS